MNVSTLLLSCLLLLAPATRPADPLAGATVNIRLPDGTAGEYELVSTRKIDPPTTKDVPTTPQSVGRINVSLGSGMAPATVFVHALDIPGVTDDPVRYRYRWDFGDKNAPQPLPGFNAAHTYDTPGDYTVTLTLVTPAGENKTFTTRITVSPDTRRNLFLSADGNDANKGDDPARAVRTWGRARQLIGDRTRLLLRRGDSFDTDASVKLPVKDFMLGGYGELAKPLPVLNFVGGLKNVPLLDCTGAEDFVVDGVAFDSKYRDNNEKTGMPDAFRAAGRRVTARNCVFRNMGYAFNGNGNPEGLLVQRCAAPASNSIRSYFAWVEGSDCVYLDNFVANSSREHVLRMSGATRVLISGNRFTNQDNSKTDKTDTAKGSCVIQKGSYAYVAGNVFREGPVGVGPLADGDGLRHPESRFDAAVVENNRLDGTFFSLEHGASRVAIRNNRIRFDGGSAISLHGFNKTYDRGTSDVIVDHNTMLNADSVGRSIRSYSALKNIEITNNLYLAPKLEPGSHGTAAIYLEGETLGSFSKIGNNVWPLGKPLAFAQGGSAYVWPKWSDSQGYKTAAEWNAMPPVSGDRFENLPLDAKVSGVGWDESQLPPEKVGK